MAHHLRRKWCCSFAAPPSSPENPVIIPKTLLKKTSAPNSPQCSKSASKFVARIDPRRILSPGRVSPIDSNTTPDAVREIAPPDPPPHAVSVARKSRSDSFRGRNEGSGSGLDPYGGLFSVRLTVRGKNGAGLVLEMRSDVLIANSEVFSGLISDYRKRLGSKCHGDSSSSKVCRIEVPEVENLGVFRDTIELMFEEDITKKLIKIGAHNAIDILEVSAGIKFTKGVVSCLKYLEAVPWTEEEEEKLRNLLTVISFDKTTCEDILARLYLPNHVDSQKNLARQLVCSITSCKDANARNELKSLVKGLLCKSSVYDKDQHDINKEDLYVVCQSCLDSLVSLLDKTSVTAAAQTRAAKTEAGKPLIECVSRQVDNINWLLEILLDRHIGEEFVAMWADQRELLKMHDMASPMIRYELSRVSAYLFIAMGTRKLHCRTDMRAALFKAWFGPMLLDFGWLQRCRKGLDIKALEEAMGQTLLTLPLNEQYLLFMEWFRCFSKHGTECPNFSKAFQIWWRRSSSRGSESHAVESR